MPENDEGSHWRKKKDETQFLNAHNGVILCLPFQCDTRWFINLCKREPSALSNSDERLMGYIRRVNLDLMWSRERGTVANTLAAVNKGKTMSIELGLVPQVVKLGPWPLGDDQGFQMAISITLGKVEQWHESSYPTWSLKWLWDFIIGLL